MKVTIGSKKLSEILLREDTCMPHFGQKMTKVIFRRLNQLTAAPSLETMRNIGRCHELKGNLEGCFALDLIHPKRLIFKPDAEDKNYLNGRSIVWKLVSSVEIMDIQDYHK